MKFDLPELNAKIVTVGVLKIDLTFWSIIPFLWRKNAVRRYSSPRETMSKGLATKDGTADFWRICEVPKIHFGNGLT
jgi:hypothetical protein